MKSLALINLSHTFLLKSEDMWMRKNRRVLNFLSLEIHIILFFVLFYSINPMVLIAQVVEFITKLVQSSGMLIRKRD